ncbi:MAG: polysaccharide biosynthesis tyrosine autokinase [Verrucomicrobiota bacterium]|nr:polysaccharide biosynthesis tyrosine autokinase [Verrucomicrobiota bacterium]
MNTTISNNTATTPLGANDFISLADLFHIIRQRWILASSAALVLTALFAIVLLNQTPQYEAEALLVVELSADKVVNVQEVVENSVQNSSLLETAMNTHIERLKSRTMAGSVVASLSEAQQIKLTEAITGPLEEIPLEEQPELVTLIIEEMLSISWLPDSQVLRVRIKHADRHLAKLVADRYAQLYIRSQTTLRGQSTEQAVEFLDAQTVELKERLEKEEAALQAYRSDNDLVTVEQNQQIVTERLSDLSKAITEARVRLVGVESYRNQITDAGDNLDLIMNLPFVGGKLNVAEIYNELQDLKTEQRILAETYLERHPMMVENLAAQKAVSEALWMAIRQSSQEYTVEEARIGEELASLNAELDAAKEESRRLESLAIEYRVLSRKVEAQRDIFDRITSRFNETSVSQQINSTTIRIIDLAALPREPVWPDVKKIGLASILLFGFIFVGLPFGIELLDNRLRSFDDIERYVSKQILGDIPLKKNKSAEAMAQLSASEDVNERESLAAIYGALRMSLGTFSKPLSFVVTSSVPSEGKSIVATNLAATLAARGYKTLVVDCDLRRPSQHRYHSLDNRLGLIEWLRSDSAIAEDLMADSQLGIRELGDSGKHFLLTSGGSTTHAGSILENPRMDQLVSRLKQEFDILIYDTPPIGVFHDAALVGDYADHCIFVARQNETTRQKTRHSVNLMDRSRAKVIGVIFNGVANLRAAAGYGSYGGSYSERYQYGYGKGAKDYARSYAES